MPMWANLPANKVEQITSISRVEIVTVTYKFKNKSFRIINFGVYQAHDVFEADRNFDWCGQNYKVLAFARHLPTKVCSL